MIDFYPKSYHNAIHGFHYFVFNEVHVHSHKYLFLDNMEFSSAVYILEER